MKKILTILPILLILLSCKKEFQEITIEETNEKIKANPISSEGDDDGVIKEEDDGGDPGTVGNNSLIGLNSGYATYSPTGYSIRVKYKRQPNNYLTDDGVTIVKTGGLSSTTISNRSHVFNANQNTITFTVMFTLRTQPLGTPYPYYENVVHHIAIDVLNESFSVY